MGALDLSDDRLAGRTAEADLVVDVAAIAELDVLVVEGRAAELPTRASRRGALTGPLDQSGAAADAGDRAAEVAGGRLEVLWVRSVAVGLPGHVGEPRLDQVAVALVAERSDGDVHHSASPSQRSPPGRMARPDGSTSRGGDPQRRFMRPPQKRPRAPQPREAPGTPRWMDPSARTLCSEVCADGFPELTRNASVVRPRCSLEVLAYLPGEHRRDERRLAVLRFAGTHCYVNRLERPQVHGLGLAAVI